MKWPFTLWRAQRGFKRGIKRSGVPPSQQKSFYEKYREQLRAYRLTSLFRTVFLLSKENQM